MEMRVGERESASPAHRHHFAHRWNRTSSSKEEYCEEGEKEREGWNLYVNVMFQEQVFILNNWCDHRTHFARDENPPLSLAFSFGKGWWEKRELEKVGKMMMKKEGEKMLSLTRAQESGCSRDDPSLEMRLSIGSPSFLGWWSLTHDVCSFLSLSLSVFFHQIFLLSFWLESASNLRLKHEGRNCYLVRRIGKERIGKDKEGRKWKCTIVPRKEKRIRSPSLSFSLFPDNERVRSWEPLFGSSDLGVVYCFPLFHLLSLSLTWTLLYTLSHYIFSLSFWERVFLSR